VAANFDSVDTYIASFPEDVQPVLQGVRAAVHAGVPGLTEGISYQMPVFRLDGRPIVQFGGWKRHVGMYPVPDDLALEDELAAYRSTKGTVKFPLNEPVPYELVERIVTMIASRQPA
jgi:uncharacterized protein YdhG (YjbR/CyaY superfamily)